MFDPNEFSTEREARRALALELESRRKSLVGFGGSTSPGAEHDIEQLEHIARMNRMGDKFSPMDLQQLPFGLGWEIQRKFSSLIERPPEFLDPLPPAPQPPLESPRPFWEPEPPRPDGF